MKNLISIVLFIGLALCTLLTVGAFLGVVSLLQAGLATVFYSACLIFTISRFNFDTK